MRCSRSVAKRFCTLAVWEDDIALTKFIHKRPIKKRLAVMRRLVGGSEFIRWRVKGGAVPPTWAEGIQRFHKKPAPNKAGGAGK